MKLHIIAAIAILCFPRIAIALPEKILNVSPKGISIDFKEPIQDIEIQDPDYVHLKNINGYLCPSPQNCPADLATSFALQPTTKPLLPPDPKSLANGTAITVTTRDGKYYFRAIWSREIAVPRSLRADSPSLSLTRTHSGQSLSSTRLANLLSSGFLWHKDRYPKKKWKAINTAIILLRQGKPLEAASRGSGLPTSELIRLINSAIEKEIK